MSKRIESDRHIYLVPGTNGKVKILDPADQETELSPTFTQTYSTASATVPAATAAAVATTAATNSSPYGYSQAQADAIKTAVNALIDDQLAIRKTQNSIIDALQAIGLVS